MEQNEFLEYIMHDALAEVPDITAKRMFGGYGLYKDELFFAIIADKQLFFKVSQQTKPLYEAAGSQPFKYNRQDKEIVMDTYWEVPAHVLEDQGTIAQWVQAACITEKN